jgi:NADH:ubiquinone oxidoreductase subunit H
MSYLIVTTKTLILCLIAIALRGTLPRYRFDQITQLN